MSDQATRDRIRAAILEAVADGATTAPLLVEEADNLAEHVERALFGDGSPEEYAAHWRANAAEEKRKKQHVSGLLAEALREKAELEAEVRCLNDAIWESPLGGYYVRLATMPAMAMNFYAPRIAALLLRQTATDHAQGKSQPAGEHPGEIGLEGY